MVRIPSSIIIYMHSTTKGSEQSEIKTKTNEKTSEKKYKKAPLFQIRFRRPRVSVLPLHFYLHSFLFRSLEGLTSSIPFSRFGCSLVQRFVDDFIPATMADVLKVEQRTVAVVASAKCGIL